ncbi:MAG: GTPase HflX [Lachnospiraceae bacterium]|nr:GTPase HflX [Lachnospiraceae bacterium]
MIELKEEPEKVILVGVLTDKTTEEELNASIDELEDLAKTAGAVCVGKVIQNRQKIHNATYIGKGKLQELKAMVNALNVDSIICDDELSPTQITNISDETGVKVIDRTVLILDIFAQHAKSQEGKLQVELAQLNYNSSHLTGSYRKMSRLGGGIGTRGPGEQKIEQDRRIIRNKINIIKKEIEKQDKNRDNIRKKRVKDLIPVVAIVGYTNAGKSTLLNYLTDAGVLSQDKLFATLDPTTRKYTYEDGEEILFTDTVGFVNKLPHHLVSAFKSTLMEAKYADLVLHVVDASLENVDRQMKTVYETLANLGIRYDNAVTVFNKIDKLSEEDREMDKTGFDLKHVARISAKTGEGVDEMLDIIRNIFKERSVLVDTILPYSDASKVQILRERGRLISEEYVGEGIKVKGHIPKELEYLFK